MNQINSGEVKAGDILYVEWVDPRLYQEKTGGWAWVYPEEDEDWALPCFKSLGYVILLDNEKLVLSQTTGLHGEEPFGPPLILPLGVIVFWGKGRVAESRDTTTVSTTTGTGILEAW